ncbi:Protein NRT1/ PTR FAMILY 5.8 [Camellia lanceoleosa]|nr:Protein NRT1/ PTR FAMILY 5.8 [Camellia lanceoleosa]
MARTQGLNKPCILIIVIAGMERFAFKGVASNLVTYLTDVMKMSNSSAAKTVNSWCGFTSLLSLLVAPLADSYWDQYSTILFSSFLYALGLLALTSTTLLTNKTSSTSSLLWSLYIISIGQGGYNPSLQVLGADQLENEDETLPCSKNERNSDKSLFFGWSYFGICSGRLLGFAIPAIMMVTSIAFFSCGSKFFVYKQANKGGDVKSLKNIVHAIKGTAAKMMNVQLTVLEEQKPLSHQDLDGSEGVDKSSNTGIHLPEIAKVILHLLPTWTTLLMFAVIFQQPMTFFTKQGISVMQRMGIGMLLSVIAMVIAALVETKRLKISKNTQSETVPLGIFWLLPQYILLGISDIFTVIGMQEYFLQ